MDEKDCGCEHRKDWLNDKIPGLGDQVESVASPIYNTYLSLGGKIMPTLLKPDMKAIVWLAIGAFVVPMVLKKF